MWLLLALLSAITLGVYDVLKKYSVRENAVFPVLLISCISSALIFLPLILLSNTNPQLMNKISLFVPTLNAHEHVLVLLKSILVVTSWVLSFFALKNLPLTIVSPIRATGPVWTLVGAIFIYAERLNTMQWVGIVITICFFYMFSIAGKKEGISFRKNKWIAYIILATLLGAVSGLYDKYLMQHHDRIAVQAWFSIYQVVLLAPTTLLFWFPIRKQTPFKWRWTIPLIGAFLVIADFLYFYALSYPESLISIVSAVRRSGIVIAFTLGAILFKEKNIKQKAIYLAGIIVGVMIIMFS